MFSFQAISLIPDFTMLKDQIHTQEGVVLLSRGNCAERTGLPRPPGQPLAPFGASPAADVGRTCALLSQQCNAPRYTKWKVKEQDCAVTFHVTQGQKTLNDSLHRGGCLEEQVCPSAGVCESRKTRHIGEFSKLSSP